MQEITNTPQPKNKKLSWRSSGKQKEITWIPFLAGTWFLGCLVLYFLYQITDISLAETLKFFVFFAVICTLIPLKWIRKYVEVDFSTFIAVNVIGLGPILSSLFLLINMLFAGSSSMESHRISSFARSKVPFENNFIEIKLDGDALKEQPKFRRFDYTQYIEVLMENDSISYTIQKGFFGYDVLSDYQFH